MSSFGSMSCHKLVECCTAVVLTFCPHSSSNCLTFCVGRVFFTLFVMFSCAPDPCRICQVILSPLVRFCSESFLCPIASINKIIIIIIIIIIICHLLCKCCVIFCCSLSIKSSSSSSSSSFLKRLAGKIADHDGAAYSHVMSFLRCRIAFALLRSSIMCIRGSRSSRHSPALEHRHLSMAEGRGEDC